jgi:hypothetical protein
MPFASIDTVGKCNRLALLITCISTRTLRTIQKAGHIFPTSELLSRGTKENYLVITVFAQAQFFTRLTEATVVMSPARRDSWAKLDVSDTQTYDSLVQHVLKSGVKFAAGSDMGWCFPGEDARPDFGLEVSRVASSRNVFARRDSGDYDQRRGNVGLARPSRCHLSLENLPTSLPWPEIRSLTLRRSNASAL